MNDDVLGLKAAVDQLMANVTLIGPYLLVALVILAALLFAFGLGRR